MNCTCSLQINAKQTVSQRSFKLSVNENVHDLRIDKMLVAYGLCNTVANYDVPMHVHAVVVTCSIQPTMCINCSLVLSLSSAHACNIASDDL